MTTIERPNDVLIEPPSAAKIVTATGLALIVAAVLLVLFVLPAEYGIDPAGTGKALGLTDLVRAADKPAQASDTSIAPVLIPSQTGDAPTVKGAFIAQPGRFQFDSRELTLGPHEGLENQVRHEKGSRSDLLVEGERDGIL